MNGDTNRANGKKGVCVLHNGMTEPRGGAVEMLDRGPQHCNTHWTEGSDAVVLAVEPRGTAFEKKHLEKKNWALN